MINELIKSIVAITFLLLSHLISAQHIFDKQIQFGLEDLTDQKVSVNPEFIGKWKDKIVAISAKMVHPNRSDLYVSEYSQSDLTKLIRFELVFKDKEKILRKVDQFVFQDNIIFITEYRDKKLDRRLFYLQKYLGNGRVSSPRLIGSMILCRETVQEMETIKISGAVTQKTKQYSPMQIAIAKDNSKFVILFPENCLRMESDSCVWHSIGFDANLVSEWNFDFDLENPSLLIDNVNLSENNQLICSIIENPIKMNTIYNRASQLRLQYSADSYQVGIINGSNKEFRKFDIQANTSLITSYKLALVDSSIIFCGMQGKKKGYSSSLGIIIKKMNLEGVELFSTQTDLERDNFSQYENGEGPFNDLKRLDRIFGPVLHDLSFTENGQMIVLVENYGFFYSGYSTDTWLVYGGINAISFSSIDGSEKWQNTIEKHQISRAGQDVGYFSSFYHHIDQEEIYLLYSVDEFFAGLSDFEDKTRKEIRAAKMNSIIMSTKISESGELTKELFFENNIHSKDYQVALKKGIFLEEEKTVLFPAVNWTVLSHKTIAKFSLIE